MMPPPKLEIDKDNDAGIIRNIEVVITWFRLG